MKMKWLHMEFVFIFITGTSWGKLGRTAAKSLLTLASLAESMTQFDVFHTIFLSSTQSSKNLKFIKKCPCVSSLKLKIW